MSEVIKVAFGLPLVLAVPQSDQPVVELHDWRLVKTEQGSTHIVGMEEGAGRVSSNVIEYDSVTQTAVTASGRQYVLLGDCGSHPISDRVWAIFKSMHQLSEQE